MMALMSLMAEKLGPVFSTPTLCSAAGASSVAASVNTVRLDSVAERGVNKERAAIGRDINAGVGGCTQAPLFAWLLTPRQGAVSAMVRGVLIYLGCVR